MTLYRGAKSPCHIQPGVKKSICKPAIPLIQAPTKQVLPQGRSNLENKAARENDQRLLGLLPRIGRRRILRLQRGQGHGIRPRRRRRRISPGSLPRRVKRRRQRQRQESRRKPMSQRDQGKRPPLKSYPERRPKQKRERGRRLRQGPRLRLRSRKRWRR